MNQIQVNELSKFYGQYKALDGVNVSFAQGKQYSIQGASGSGKSTLLYMLAGLEKPTDGNVLSFGQDLAELNDDELAIYRNQQIGLIFQFHFLLSSMTCWENILLPARIRGNSVKEVRKFCHEMATKLDILDCLDKYPSELSGGQQQRVNTLRAISLKPKVILCDEPTGSLDSKNSKNVIQILRNLASSLNSTLVVVTHDAAMAREFDHQFFMQDGRIKELPALPLN